MSFEENISMKMSRKYSHLGSVVRRSKEYILERFRLANQGYDVYDQIRFSGERGWLKLLGIPKNLPTDAKTRIITLHFQYKYSRLTSTVVFEPEEDRHTREVSLILDPHRSKLSPAAKEAIQELTKPDAVPNDKGIVL